MSEDHKIIQRGPLRGKKITFASTDRVEEFRQIANDFMDQVFDIETGEYLISDESDILDFTEMGSSDTSAIWRRISEIYGINLSGVESGRLVNIFAEIVRRRNMQ